MKMQQNFIDELENRGKQNIDSNNNKITNLMSEVDQYLKIILNFKKIYKTLQKQRKLRSETKVSETKHT